MRLVLVASLLVLIAGVQADFGQLLLAYYSGLGADTVGSGGVNALALAFFDPTPLGQQQCDFSNAANAPCIRPATGSGEGKTLSWAISVITQTAPALSANTSPNRGGKPTIFFSFGGQSQGGATWDHIFSSASSASMLGTNAAKLVTTVYKLVGQKAYIGFDLDVEETSTKLPNFGSFIKAFRASAPFDTYPLQMCALSGLSNPGNPDYFKVSLVQQFGPAQQGLNFLNMMVNNVDSSCAVMSTYWRNSSLDFIPPKNKILGVWGELLPSWILHEPGCTTGSDPLFPWMKKNGVGIGIWQWWTGPTSDILKLINQVRAG